MIAFYLSLLIPVLGYIVALYQIPKDMYTAKNQYSESKNKWQRLNHKGRRYVTISFIVAIVAEVGLILKGPEKPNPQSVKVETQKNTVYVTKVVKDTIKEKTTTKENSIPPVLDVIDDSVKFSGKIERPEISFYLKSANNEIVFNTTTKFLLLYLNKDTIASSLVIPVTNQLSLKAYNNVTLYHTVPLVIDTNDVMKSPFYIYYKATYYDKEIKGTLQPPLRRLYVVTLPEHPKSTKELIVKQVNTDTMITILKRELIRKKYW